MGRVRVVDGGLEFPLCDFFIDLKKDICQDG